MLECQYPNSLIALIAQVAMSFFLWLGTQFPSDPFWASNNDQASWDKFFGAVPRIMIASWVAFAVSETVDVYIFAWFKKLTHGRHIWLRNIFSSIPALAIDSIIFVPLAFYGTLPLSVIFVIIKGQIILKWIVGVVNIPFMYMNHAIMKYGRETPDSVVWEESSEK